MPLPEGLDAKDVAIVEALQADGRISLSALGRRIGLSQPSMSERVKRLEERGIIIGYGARIDPLALGLALGAIIRLKTTHEHMRACLETFDRLPYVVEVHRVTGDDCFVLKALVPSAGDLATIVDAIGRFGPVTTSVVLQSQPPRPIGKALLGPRVRLQPAPRTTA
jgi:Lrp/AsnC family leucine-responsive transcriptional regulator